MNDPDLVKKNSYLFLLNNIINILFSLLLSFGLISCRADKNKKQGKTQKEVTQFNTQGSIRPGTQSSGTTGPTLDFIITSVPGPTNTYVEGIQTNFGIISGRQTVVGIYDHTTSNANIVIEGTCSRSVSAVTVQSTLGVSFIDQNCTDDGRWRLADLHLGSEGSYQITFYAQSGVTGNINRIQLNLTYAQSSGASGMTWTIIGADNQNQLAITSTGNNIDGVCSSNITNMTLLTLGEGISIVNSGSCQQSGTFSLSVDSGFSGAHNLQVQLTNTNQETEVKAFAIEYTQLVLTSTEYGTLITPTGSGPYTLTTNTARGVLQGTCSNNISTLSSSISTDVRVTDTDCSDGNFELELLGVSSSTGYESVDITAQGQLSTLTLRLDINYLDPSQYLKVTNCYPAAIDSSGNFTPEGSCDQNSIGASQLILDEYNGNTLVQSYNVSCSGPIVDNLGQWTYSSQIQLTAGVTKTFQVRDPNNSSTSPSCNLDYTPELTVNSPYSGQPLVAYQDKTFHYPPSGTAGLIADSTFISSGGSGQLEFTLVARSGETLPAWLSNGGFNQSTGQMHALVDEDPSLVQAASTSGDPITHIFDIQVRDTVTQEVKTIEAVLINVYYDPLAYYQWHLKNRDQLVQLGYQNYGIANYYQTGANDMDIGLYKPFYTDSDGDWSIQDMYTGQGVTVLISDTGLDIRHEDFKQRQSNGSLQTAPGIAHSDHVNFLSPNDLNWFTGNPSNFQYDVQDYSCQSGINTTSGGVTTTSLAPSEIYLASFCGIGWVNLAENDPSIVADGEENVDPTTTFTGTLESEFIDTGTALGGLIAAQPWNNIGGKGISPNVKLIAYNTANWLVNLNDYQMIDMMYPFLNQTKYTDEVTNTDYDSVTVDDYTTYVTYFRQFDYSSNTANFVDIVNHGWVYNLQMTSDGNSSTSEQFYLNTDTLDDIYIDRLRTSGSFNVKWAGSLYGLVSANHFKLNSNPYSVVVSAINAKGERASLASIGSTLWLSAPGGDVTWPNSAVGLWKKVGDTSGIRPGLVTLDQSGLSFGFARNDVLASVLGRSEDTTLPEPMYPTVPSLNTSINLNADGDYTGRLTRGSTAIVSGVAALMQEAYMDGHSGSKLNWRGLKHILAKTAINKGNNTGWYPTDNFSQNVGTNSSLPPLYQFKDVEGRFPLINVSNTTVFESADSESWLQNGAGNWYSNAFGFGMINAPAAVAMAKTFDSNDPIAQNNFEEYIFEYSVFPEDDRQLASSHYLFGQIVDGSAGSSFSAGRDTGSGSSDPLATTPWGVALIAQNSNTNPIVLDAIEASSLSGGPYQVDHAIKILQDSSSNRYGSSLTNMTRIDIDVSSIVPSNFIVEGISLRPYIHHPDIGQLGVIVKSPSGTLSTVLHPNYAIDSYREDHYIFHLSSTATVSGSTLKEDEGHIGVILGNPFNYDQTQVYNAVGGMNELSKNKGRFMRYQPLQLHTNAFYEEPARNGSNNIWSIYLYDGDNTDVGTTYTVDIDTNDYNVTGTSTFNTSSDGRLIGLRFVVYGHTE